MHGAQGLAKMLGMYQIGPFLGAGPVGDVYRAHQPGQETRELAVKILRGPFSQKPAVRTRFTTITTAVQRLDHPHILPLEFAGEQNGQLYSVMPAVVQGSMLARLTRGRMSPKDIAPLFKQICDALSYAHAQGIMHGNLKPTNIMLFESRHVLVADFGQLWQPLEMDLTQHGMPPEALHYLAPEQADGSYDVRSDIYSLGVILYQALTAVVPFTGKTAFEVMSRHQRQAAPSLSQVNPPLPQGALVFDEVLRMALAKDPNSRFQSPIAMARAIVEAGNLANDLPSRLMPVIRPSMQPSQVPLLGPPRQQFPQGQDPRYMMPNGMRPMLPPGPPPLMGPPGGPWQNQQQQPLSRPQMPGYPMPGQMPPMHPSGQMPPGMRPPTQPDDPLSWLIPPGSQPLSRPPSRPINSEMADFLTARRPVSDLLPEDSAHIAGAEPPFNSETGSVARADDRWDNDESPSVYSREFTGMRSDVRKREWVDDDEYDRSRSMAVPAQRRPSRPTDNRDQWDDTRYSGRYPARRGRDEGEYDDASREMRRARPGPSSRPNRRDSRPYDDEHMRPSASRSRPMRPMAAPPPPKKRSRKPAVLSMVIALILVVNGFLLVLLAPEKCGKTCISLHAKLAQVLHLSGPSQPAITAQAGNTPLTAYPGANVTVQQGLTINAPGNATLTWTATADLAWVVFTPNGGQIVPGTPLTLGVQLAPDATVKPGNYQANVTVKAGGTSASVTLPIIITTPPKLTPEKSALHFTQCGQSLTDILTNAGGAPLINLKANASDPAVTTVLDATSLDPAKTAKLTVKINCSATGKTFAVNLVSSAGTTPIAVTLG